MMFPGSTAAGCSSAGKMQPDHTETYDGRLRNDPVSNFGTIQSHRDTHPAAHTTFRLFLFFYDVVSAWSGRPCSGGMGCQMNVGPSNLQRTEMQGWIKSGSRR